uniref:Uncharacterized protein n=1 Tax=Anguilla anguilla TaxID=7936 RepID=A0A0E9PU96_ANGAN
MSHQSPNIWGSIETHT